MSRSLRLGFVMLVFGTTCPTAGIGQSPQPLSEVQRQAFEKSAAELNTELEGRPDRQSATWADAAIFAKGLSWSLRYDREFTPADIALLEKSIRRVHERHAAIVKQTRPWSDRRGKIALGYVSKVDGSVQPYGLIVPSCTAARGQSG
jgi:hypothetical protein